MNRYERYTKFKDKRDDDIYNIKTVGNFEYIVDIKHHIKRFIIRNYIKYFKSIKH